MKDNLTNGAEAKCVARSTAQPRGKYSGKYGGNLCEKSTETLSSQLAADTVTPSEDEILSHAFLTIEEVARLLRVSKRTVYNLIYKGTLRATRVSYHVSIIPKSDFMDMLERNSYNKVTTAFPKRHNRKANKPKTEDESDPIESQEEPCGEDLVKELPQTRTEETPVQASAKKTKPRKIATRKLIPSSAYNQSVRDTFVDGKEYDQSQLYTMAEICRKYKCTYGWFYNLRMRYNIPCVKANKTKCFPIEEVDKAISTERERLGSDLAEHWYTCFDIMRLYGLGMTQVRRFAETHGVRIKKCGHCNHYLKADWEAARKKAEAISVSTKTKRE